MGHDKTEADVDGGEREHGRGVVLWREGKSTPRGNHRIEATIRICEALREEGTCYLGEARLGLATGAAAAGARPVVLDSCSFNAGTMLKLSWCYLPTYESRWRYNVDG